MTITITITNYYYGVVLTSIKYSLKICHSGYVFVLIHVFISFILIASKIAEKSITKTPKLKRKK